MRATIVDCDQRSEPWFLSRLGRATGSRASDFQVKLKDGKSWGASRAKYKAQLVVERLTKRSQEKTYVSASMLQGIEREAAALALYEAMTGNLTTPIGFYQHTDLMCGFSPDGIVGDPSKPDILVEAKSPEVHTHLEYMLTGQIPHDYACQIVHGLFVTGAREAHWISYNPDFVDPRLQLKMVTVTSTEREMAAYEIVLRDFLGEVDKTYQQVLEKLAVAA